MEGGEALTREHLPPSVALVEECHVGHRAALGFGVHENTMPERQSDRLVIGVTHLPASINVRVPGHHSPTPMGALHCLSCSRALYSSPSAHWGAVGRRKPFHRRCESTVRPGEACLAHDGAARCGRRTCHLPPTKAPARRTIHLGGETPGSSGDSVCPTRLARERAPDAKCLRLERIHGLTYRRGPPGTAATNHSRSSWPQRKRSVCGLSAVLRTSSSRCRCLGSLCNTTRPSVALRCVGTRSSKNSPLLSRWISKE